MDVVVTEKLTDGTVVEDMDARGRVISQVLGEYPPVFREALMLMKNHGTMELVAPPELAYGDEGYPPRVPPGATMIYTLRVEDVKPAAETETGHSPSRTRKLQKKGLKETINERYVVFSEIIAGADGMQFYFRNTARLGG
ncbi:FKBP-type peptidyl-prolyl cis-trans isomerase [Escherichia coli]